MEEEAQRSLKLVGTKPTSKSQQKIKEEEREICGTCVGALLLIDDREHGLAAIGTAGLLPSSVEPVKPTSYRQRRSSVKVIIRSL